MYKKLSITTIILLLLSITVSFAWMIDMMGPSGDVIILGFDNSLYASPNNLRIDISIEEEGEYVPLYSTENDNTLVTFNNCAPGSTFKFSVKMYNLTDLAMVTSIIFTDIESDIDDFYYDISMGIFSTHGFDALHPAPSLVDFNIIDRMEHNDDGDVIIKEKNSIHLVDDLKIPPNEEEVEIRFYVRFNHRTTSQNHLQNKYFTIGKINFLCM